MPKQLSDGNPDGTILGQSTTDLISFFGGTPVDQPVLVTNTSGTLGNTNAAVNAIITALVSLGLCAPGT
jgi:hypothetical protein